MHIANPYVGRFNIPLTCIIILIALYSLQFPDNKMISIEEAPKLVYAFWT